MIRPFPFQKSMRFVPLLMLAFVAYPVCGLSETTTSLTTTVDRSETRVADPFTLTLTLDTTSETDVDFPAVGESLGPFQVVSSRDAFDVPTETGRRWTRDWRLETYESGQLQIPAITVIVDGEPRQTKPISIVVASQLQETTDPTEFRGIKAIEDIPQPNTVSKNYMFLIAGVTVILAVVAFLFWKQRSESSPTPEAWAQERLERIRSSAAYQAKQQTVVLPQAANVLREYIRLRFHIDAPQQTTDEFLERIQDDPILGADQRVELQAFLRHVDAVKFAHLVPKVDQLDETLERVRQFIQQSVHEPGDETKAESLSQPENV